MVRLRLLYILCFLNGTFKNIEWVLGAPNDDDFDLLIAAEQLKMAELAAKQKKIALEMCQGVKYYSDDDEDAEINGGLFWNDTLNLGVQNKYERRFVKEPRSISNGSKKWRGRKCTLSTWLK